MDCPQAHSFCCGLHNCGKGILIRFRNDNFITKAAEAGTRFHLNGDGDLLDHSCNVDNILTTGVDMDNMTTTGVDL